MKVHFIKPWTLEDGRVIKPGQWATLWDANPAINAGAAVPYNQKNIYESQAKSPAKPQSGKKKETDSFKAKKKVKIKLKEE